MAEPQVLAIAFGFNLGKQEGDFGRQLLAAGEPLGITDRVGQRQDETRTRWMRSIEAVPLTGTFSKLTRV